MEATCIGRRRNTSAEPICSGNSRIEAGNEYRIGRNRELIALDGSDQLARMDEATAVSVMQLLEKSWKPIHPGVRFV